MRGGFQGEWWTYSRVPLKPIAAVIGAAIAVAWIAAHRILVATIVAVTFALIGAAVVFLRRTSDRDAEALARQSAGLCAEIAAETAAPPRETQIHYHGGTHLHIGEGADPAALAALAPHS